MWITSLLFDLNYESINRSFAFSPGQTMQRVWLRDYQLILQDTAPNCIYKINRSITYSHNGKRFIKRCRLQLSSWTLLKGVCNVQLWTNSVHLRTKLKFLYLSGSHQLYLLYRNQEPTKPKLPITTLNGSWSH